MHKKYEDLVLLYTTRSINAEQLADLQAHLAECPQCRASLAEWRAIAAAVKATARERERLPLKEQTMIATRPMPYGRGFSMATLLVVTLLGGLLTFLNRPQPQIVSQELATTTTPTPRVEYVQLVIAAQPIENGAVIQEDDVMLYWVPLETARFHAMHALEDVVHSIARSNIACGQLILQTEIATNARDVADEQPALFNEEDYACREGALEPLQEPVELVDVIIPERLIPAGTRVNASDVALVSYPAQLVPSAALTNLEDVVGNMTTTTLYIEQIILSDFVYVEIQSMDVSSLMTGTPATPIPMITMTPGERTSPTAICRVRLSGEAIPIHSGPSSDTPVVSTISGGFTVDVSEIGSDGVHPDEVWYGVDDLGGWVQIAYVQPSPSNPCPVVNVANPATSPLFTPPPPTLCQVIAADVPLSVRQMPDESAAIIVNVPLELTLDVVALELDGEQLWYRVRSLATNGSGFEGWVQADAVQPSGSACPSFADTLAMTATAVMIEAARSSQPQVVCQVIPAGTPIGVRQAPDESAAVIVNVPLELLMDVLALELDATGQVWYRVRMLYPNGSGFDGWIQASDVQSFGDVSCPTLSSTAAGTSVPASTPTAAFTATPEIICQVVVGTQPMNVRTSPNVSAEVAYVIQANTVLDVIGQQIGDTYPWYHVLYRNTLGTLLEGWMRAEGVQTRADNPCPAFP